MQRGLSGDRASRRWRLALPCGTRGYSLIQVVVTLSLVAILGAIAVPKWKATQMNIVTARRLVLATLRLARTNAITKSIHYQVSFPSDMGHITLSGMLQSPAGSGIWVVDQTKVQTTALPASTQVAASSQAITVEFNTRGMVVNSTAVVQINLTDAFGLTRSLKVWPSGQMNET
jgi:Tfp pilus assembly protein FimT